MDLIPGSGRSPAGGNDNPLQYSCLGNSWPEEPVGLYHVITKSTHTHTHTHTHAIGIVLIKLT